MKSNRFVRHETDTLTLSDGDWLIVRRRLNHGEQGKAFTRMYLAGADGSRRTDPLRVADEKIAAYLLDWSLTDNGQPMIIRGQEPDAIVAALALLDPEDFAEVNAAIDKHEADVEAARAQEKKLRAGESGAPATSASPSAAAGASSGSES